MKRWIPAKAGMTKSWQLRKTERPCADKVASQFRWFPFVGANNYSPLHARATGFCQIKPPKTEGYLLTTGQSHHHRHSGESRNPEAEFVNSVSDSFTHTIMDSGFRRSDGRLNYDAIALLLTTGPFPPAERRCYHTPTGDNRTDAASHTGFPSSTATNTFQHPSRLPGTRGRLSPTALTGAVPSATASATTRHAVGMENQSAKPSAYPPAVGLKYDGNPVKTNIHRLHAFTFNQPGGNLHQRQR